MKIACFVLFLFVLTPFNSFCAESPAGTIEGFSGNVFWKKTKDAAQTSLDAKKTFLFAEERLKCDEGATLTIQLYGKTDTIKCPSGWFPIPSMPQMPALTKQALEDSWRIGGREMGEEAGVFSPADLSKIRVSNFEIRWVSGVAMRSFILVSLEKKATEIWKETVPNDAKGRFVSPGLTEALLKYRRESPDGTLVLKWEDNSNQTGTVRFSLLSDEEEKQLQENLAYWDREPDGIMKYLGRASVFLRLRMFPQAADEYEAALKRAPKSHDLIRRTADAHRRTGNFVRHEELLKQIQ
jgi:hypothetical protein